MSQSSAKVTEMFPALDGCIVKEKTCGSNPSPLKSMSRCFYYWLAPRRLFSQRAVPIL